MKPKPRGMLVAAYWADVRSARKSLAPQADEEQ